jgi:hypothetical protein
MKYLLLILLFLGVFWYYKKKRIKARRERERLQMEMQACFSCGVFLPLSQGQRLKKGSQEIFFCSEKCLKDYLLKEEEKICS